MQAARARADAGPQGFTLCGAAAGKFDRLDAWSAALAFVRGDLEIEGDLKAAIRHALTRPGTAFRRLRTVLATRVAPLRIEHWLQTRGRARANITFHYDRSNDFFASFLDRRMVYSCAYFARPGVTLEEAQEAKLDLICRKLALSPGERFLDVGCGWGALVLYAAHEFGASAEGCTLSENQAEYARAAGARVSLCDYRAMTGGFDKIASVGMFEHVGRRRLPGYFRAVSNLLTPGGLFLNHGIVRPGGTKDGPDTLFLRRYVFPGGELAELSSVIEAAESAGFEVLDVENLRPHYGLTCTHWIERLQRNRERGLRAVSPESWRIWLLYLAASAVSFEDGGTDVCQILMAKRGSPRRPMTREYMYRSAR
ncbi:MAG TPA: class I SAM-dependent methyltransferase [Bryobacteraceae bacterium]|nr:class I SAM-dependent methyltransferase [Bryobacteraceae bacterium]